jgi:hypothetical protein
VKDDNGDLLADSNNILIRWKNYFFFQLLNVHNTSDVKQIEVHTAEPIVLGPTCLEFEIAIENMKTYKSPGHNQIPALLVGGSSGWNITVAIQKMTNSIWNKEELPDQ